MTAAAAPTRYVSLDLLRGVAALSVVSLHLSRPPDAYGPMPHAYLAVDLFFVLSGFVLAHGYGDRLAAGDARGFMRQRLRRLYPLYLVATLCGGWLARDMLLPDGSLARDAGEWLLGLCANLLLLPAPPVAPDAGALYLGTFPAWSIAWELAANLLYALAAPRLGRRALAALLALGAAGLVATAVHFGSLDVGFGWHNWWGGAGRVIWGFFAGVALQRLGAHRPRRPLPAWIPALALLAVFALPHGAGGIGVDLGFAILGAPLVVALGAAAAPGRLAAVGTWLGAVSYAVYLLHAPAMNLLDKLAMAVLGQPLTALPELPALAVLIAVSLALAHCATERIDLPLRRRRTSGRRRAALA